MSCLLRIAVINAIASTTEASPTDRITVAVCPIYNVPPVIKTFICK